MKNRLRVLRLAAGVSLVCCTASVRAELPSYVGYQLQARMNFGVNPSGSYNVPPDYFFSGEDVKVNDARQVSFHLGVTGTNDFQSVWFGQNGVGGIVYNSVDGAFLSQTSLNNNGRVAWETIFTAQNGIYFYDQPSGTSGFLTNRPLGASSWSSPRINDAGKIGYRVNFSGSGQAFVSWEAPNSTAVHAAEVGVEPGSPYSFLFTPTFNNNRQIAGKVRLGGPGQTAESRPDQIRIFNSDGSSTLIAEDMDSNAGSPYSRFDNSVALNDAGQVAFTATLQAGQRGVFLGNGTTTIPIATTTAPATPVSDIEFFAPAVNNAGIVAFRAFDTSGFRAIWVGDGTELARVVTQLDLLPSDQGTARVQQHDSSPVFGGAPWINGAGDVAFNASLTPPDDSQVEWGTGVSVARAALKGDLNCDGVVNAADAAAMVLALIDVSAYEDAHPTCMIELGDMNGDLLIDGDDVQLLVVAIVGP